MTHELSDRHLLLPVLFVVCLVAGTIDAVAQDVYQQPPDALAALVDAPTTPAVSLSPDRSHLLLMHRPNLPSIAEVAAPELRLAGLRVNPRNNGPSRSRPYRSLTIRDLAGDEIAVRGIPAEGRIRNVSWSPDSRHIAFTVDLEDRIELFAVPVSTGAARRLLNSVSDAFYGAPFDWVPGSNSLVVRTIPESAVAPPTARAVPAGPIIQEATGEEAQARTYQDLLSSPHDEALFTYYVTSQLVHVDIDGGAEPIGDPQLFYAPDLSPDGRFVLVEYLKKPYSYLVPAYRFPVTTEVWDLKGQLIQSVADLPLAEAVPTAFGSVREGVRSVGWRADTPATLSWVEARDGGDARVEADVRDEVFQQSVPFDGPPTALATLPLRYGGILWGDGDLALVYESWWSTRTRRVYAVDPDDSMKDARVIMDYSSEDRYNDPGQPLTRATDAGTRVLITADGGSSIFLSGAGASPEGNRPFLRRMDLESLTTTEFFRSEAPNYESVAALLDPESMTLLTRRESADEPPNYYLRDLKTGDLVALTNFPHPYPQLAGVSKETIQYEREDGISLTATLYLPAGYESERDGPLPALVWAYPREFKSADAAGQRYDSPYQFKYVSYWGAVPYVTQGYAVINNASMPIVGEGEEEPNDSFREQLVANAAAAIEEGARRGVVDPNRVAIGGHSYGAFMTANLLAHSNLFRAGIARSGAYNRTLTPFGFQAEERLFWDAPDIYYNMSPFMHAEKVDEPILLIHGEADNNSGTYPLQSRRYYNALKGLGKTARLVMLPHESHGYRARESIMHMLWETNRWLDLHVKNAAPTAGSGVEDPIG
ncbi:MAG: S9 family peptidase [Rhodothermales bacterium]|nr:S9 family peptidase [Rhodothermales bacterium]